MSLGCAQVLGSNYQLWCHYPDHLLGHRSDRRSPQGTLCGQKTHGDLIAGKIRKRASAPPWAIGGEMHSRLRAASTMPSASLLQEVCRPQQNLPSTRVPELLVVAPAVSAPGTVHIAAAPALSVSVAPPQYMVQIMYEGQNRSLQDAQRVWSHIGHSGWKDTLDVELQNIGPQAWRGVYLVTLAALSSVDHLEVQLAFKGVVADQERWDNNSGANWSLAIELAPGEGLLAVRPEPPPRNLVSSLLLRIEVLAAQSLLTPEQGSLLRTLAWQRDFALLKAYKKVRLQADSEVVVELQSRCGFLRRPGLHVVHIASEMAPLAKVGGLADVVVSLAKAHQAAGTLAEIILPKYDCIRYADVAELRQLVQLEVPWGGAAIKTVVWAGIAEGLPVYFVEPYSRERFFWRGRFYGEVDDAERFLFFARAALEFLVWSEATQGKQPDALHIHDWQSAAVAPLLKEQYRARGLTRPGVVLTIHNIAFQGWLTPNYLDLMGLPRAGAYTPERLLDDTRPGFAGTQADINLLKGGIVYADAVTTVSPTYAREVFAPEFGMGLQGVLGRHAGKFRGILNGIDGDMWDPATDAALPAHYTATDTAGKAACKAALLAELGLPPQPNTPLIAVVSRLTEQKGLPLILHGLRVAQQAGAQFCVLGSAPEAAVQQGFERWAAELAGGTAGRLVLRHDEALAHRIYAGADAILIPSFFEPCGLTQLIALRYGTIPVCRQTGGLADTVRDVAHSGAPEHERNGFTFAGKSEAEVETALRRAIDAYRDAGEWWHGQLVPRAMRQDWSWSRSAQDYLQLYRNLKPS